jgi:hypothetical protein
MNFAKKIYFLVSDSYETSGGKMSPQRLKW